jgi:hypothetical protein
MYVCRHWANVIREGSLLHTVSIIEGGNIDVDAFFDLLKEEPWRRKQVKKLLFGYSQWTYVEDSFRADLLVNLKFLYLSKENGQFRQYIQHLSPESVMPFMNNIEHVEDYAGSDFVYELLTRGTCPRLTTLALRLNNYSQEDDVFHDNYSDDEREVTVSKHNQYLNKNIFSFLFNAPALRKLEFTNFKFQISDFEFIHASLMQLQSLTINRGALYGDKLPDNVIPTGSLKILSLVNVSINPLSLSNMIRYMIKKYTRLSEFTIDSRLCVNQADANAFMKKFSKQLTALKLPIETGFVEWVCGFDCRLNSLTISHGIQSTLEMLSRFLQRTFLKELTILYPFDFDPAPLNELSHLKKLHISCRGMHERPEIDVASVLRSCPDNLTSLTLDDVTLKDELPVDHIFGLQELKIYSRSLPKQFDLFLSKCCPRLRSLTLKACLKAGDYLNISNLSLSYLKINLSDPKTKTRLFVVTPKIELLYYLEGYDDSNTVEGNDEEINCLLYKSCFPVKSANLPKVETTTTLSCHSVDTLIVNDRITC